MATARAEFSFLSFVIAHAAHLVASPRPEPVRTLPELGLIDGIHPMHLHRHILKLTGINGLPTPGRSEGRRHLGRISNDEWRFHCRPAWSRPLPLSYAAAHGLRLHGPVRNDLTIRGLEELDRSPAGSSFGSRDTGEILRSAIDIEVTGRTAAAVCRGTQTECPSTARLIMCSHRETHAQRNRST
jgi:hypothetical protein